MLTRLAESSGRPLERHGNVSPREMTVHGAFAPGQNPAYRPAHSPRSGGSRSSAGVCCLVPVSSVSAAATAAGPEAWAARSSPTPTAAAAAGHGGPLSRGANRGHRPVGFVGATEDSVQGMNRTAKITTAATAAVVIVGLLALTAPVVVPFLPQRVQVALAGTIHTIPGTVDDLYRQTHLGDYGDVGATTTHAGVDDEYVIAATVWPWTLPTGWAFPAQRGVPDTPGAHSTGMGVKAAFSAWATASLDTVKSGDLTPAAADAVLDEVASAYRTLISDDILADHLFIEHAVTPLRPDAARVPTSTPPAYEQGAIDYAAVAEEPTVDLASEDDPIGKRMIDELGDGYVYVGNGTAIQKGSPAGCEAPAWIHLGGMDASLSGDLVDRGARELAAGTAGLDGEGRIVSYTVAPGDALFAIGDRFCIANALTIATLNHTRTIQPAEVLLLHPDSSIPWIPYFNPFDAPAGYQQIPYQRAVEAMSAAAAAGDVDAMRAIFADDLSGLFPNPAHAEVIAQALDAGDLDALRQMFA